MYVSRSVQADHKDLVHDVAYDFYGKRLATCSSDQCVKVWGLGDDQQWQCTSSWKAHSGSVWKVTWAHPEFGQILATCSFDRTAAVWEELGPEGSVGERTHSQWVKKTSLVDSRTPVTDVKFAPRHLGLQLATCSADGVVRIYEAPDVMNLSQWSLQHELSCKLACSCLSWAPCRNQIPMIAVGSDDPNAASGSKVSLFVYSDNIRRWQRLEGINITDPINDLAFAPNVGRSFHYLAIATRSVQIILIKPIVDRNINLQESIPKFDIRQAAQFDHHNSQVWRVSWNLTGTILASSGDDGTIRLWKANFLDKWKCIAVVKGDGTTEPCDLIKNTASDATPTEMMNALSAMQYHKVTPNAAKSTLWH